MKNTTDTLIYDLLQQLSLELDLHYEDEDFFALQATFEPMRRAGEYLEQVGHSVPDVYSHVLSRFLRSKN